jgi:hypothetical protein
LWGIALKSRQLSTNVHKYELYSNLKSRQAIPYTGYSLDWQDAYFHAGIERGCYTFQE